MTTMKPCPRCHSTEHLRIEIADDHANNIHYAKVTCTECNIYAQRDYVLTGLWSEEGRVSDVQLTSDVIKQWNEQCDDWEGMFDRE